MQTLPIFKMNAKSVFIKPFRLFNIIAVCIVLAFSACKKDRQSTTPATHQLELSASATELGEPGTQVNIQVTASSAWTITIPAGIDWISLNKTSGSGNDNIIVKVEKTNNTANNRSVILTAALNNGQITDKKVTLNQATVVPDNQVNLVWAKIFGGNGNEYAYSVTKTPDGGHLLAGASSSSNNGDVPVSHGGLDALVIKLDATGNLQWKKSYGGNSNDIATGIAVTNDAGFVLTGYTLSNNSGDVGVNHGGLDFWVIKLNANGVLQWKQTLGGNGDDWPYAITVTSEGKIAVAGSSKSNNGDAGSNKGGEDFWIVVLENNDGAIAWKKSMGGNGSDIAKAIVATADGGVIVGGTTYSNNNGDVPAIKGGSDYWIVRLDKNGVIAWSKTAGGPNLEELNGLALDANNNLVAAGSTKGNGGDVSGVHGGEDMWVIQLNAANGSLKWQKALGGNFGETARSVIVNPAGNIIVAGQSHSSNSGDVGAEKGAGDFWLVGLSNTGAKLWTKLLGGDDEDIATTVAPAENHSYVVVGYTHSSASGDVTGTNHGNADMWVVKVRED